MGRRFRVEMILKTLTTQSFRNLADAETAFHPQANIVVGRNGQGKTNLLEAIYFLATTKSFRTTRIGSVFRHDVPSVFVSGLLHRDGLDRTLSVGLETGEAVELAALHHRQDARLVLQDGDVGERVAVDQQQVGVAAFAHVADRLAHLHHRRVPDCRPPAGRRRGWRGAARGWRRLRRR